MAKKKPKKGSKNKAAKKSPKKVARVKPAKQPAVEPPIAIDLTLSAEIPDSEHKLSAMLAQKMALVMHKLPIIECTGENEEDGYGFTEADHVAEKYSQAFREVGLSFIQTAVTSRVIAKGTFEALCSYRITDINTGHSITGQAASLGGNELWSLNTAQTKAAKQFLLTTFMASCPQPKHLKQQNLPPMSVGGLPATYKTQSQKVKEEMGDALDHFSTPKAEEEVNFSDFTG